MAGQALSDLFVTVGTGRFPFVWSALRVPDVRLAGI